MGFLASCKYLKRKMGKLQENLKLDTKSTCTGSQVRWESFLFGKLCYLSLLPPLAPDSPFSAQQSEGSLRKMTQSMSTSWLPTRLTVTEKHSPVADKAWPFLMAAVLPPTALPGQPHEPLFCSLKMPSRFWGHLPLQRGVHCKNLLPLQLCVTASSILCNCCSNGTSLEGLLDH